MRGACLLLLISVVSLAAGKTGATAAEVVDVVMRSLQSDQDDEGTAHEVAKLHLRERLDDETVAFLVSRNPGPRTVAATEKLCKRSANLPAPAEEPVMTTPVPSQAETQRILANVARYVGQ